MKGQEMTDAQLAEIIRLACKHLGTTTSQVQQSRLSEDKKHITILRKDGKKDNVLLADLTHSPIPEEQLATTPDNQASTKQAASNDPWKKFNRQQAGARFVYRIDGTTVAFDMGRYDSQPLYQPTETYDISVIVAFMNLHETTREMLVSMTSQAVTRLQLILLDNGSAQNVTNDWLLKIIEPALAPQIIIRSSENLGTIYGWNLAARMATAPIIIFANNDLHSFSKAWDRAILDAFKAKTTGIAGPMQFHEDGTIHSIGSEWAQHERFVHTRCGEQPKKLPKRLTQVEAITGSFLAIRSELFKAVNGFDEYYRFCRWEDSDLCMKVADKGYRIMLQPKARCVHLVKKTERPDGEGWSDKFNQQRFVQKWGETGKLERLYKNRFRKYRTPHDPVTAGIIVWNEAEYAIPCIESIYDEVDRIIIIEGAVGPNRQFAVNSHSPDGTWEQLQTFKETQDPKGKLELHTGAFENKGEMQSIWLNAVEPGTFCYMIDGDEVQVPGTIEYLRYLHAHQDCDSATVPYYHFFSNFWTLGTGIWQTFWYPQFYRKQAGLRFTNTHWPQLNGNPLGIHGRNAAGTRFPRFHYSWVKPLPKLETKLRYYKITRTDNKINPDYMTEQYLPWLFQPDVTEKLMGTHPLGGGGSSPFEGTHPYSIQRRLEAGEFPFGWGSRDPRTWERLPQSPMTQALQQLEEQLLSANHKLDPASVRSTLMHAAVECHMHESKE